MIFSVARASWMNLRRDRAGLILSFVVPIVFFSIFASVFGGRESSTPTVTVAVVDEDGSERSRQLLKALRAETALKVVERAKDAKSPFDSRTATDYVRAGHAPSALIIPKGFGATSMSFGGDNSTQPAFRLLNDPSDPIAAQVVSGMLQKTVMTSMPDMMMSGGMDAMDKWGGGVTPQQRATMNQNLTAFQQSQKNGKQSSSMSSLVKIDSVNVVGKSKNNPLIAFYAAGVGVMFLLFTATGAGGVLLEEKESGTLDRILTTRVTLTTLLSGKLLYLWSLGVIQLVVMFVWGALVFGLPLTRHLDGFAVMTAVTAFACSAFGLLLASVARTRAQLSAMSTLVVLSISAIGGSMFPRFLMPESFQKAGLILFNSWAIEGFTRVFWREEPLSALAAPVAVLVASGIVFLLVARHLTGKWDTA